MGVELNCKKRDEAKAFMSKDMNDNPTYQEGVRIAEIVRKAAVKEALEAYEHAKISGLCDEGAWECAVGAI